MTRSCAAFSLFYPQNVCLFYSKGKYVLLAHCLFLELQFAHMRVKQRISSSRVQFWPFLKEVWEGRWGYKEGVEQSRPVRRAERGSLQEGNKQRGYWAVGIHPFKGSNSLPADWACPPPTLSNPSFLPWVALPVSQKRVVSEYKNC